VYSGIELYRVVAEVVVLDGGGLHTPFRALKPRKAAMRVGDNRVPLFPAVLQDVLDG